jgi:hypothetical protein
MLQPFACNHDYLHGPDADGLEHEPTATPTKPPRRKCQHTTSSKSYRHLLRAYDKQCNKTKRCFINCTKVRTVPYYLRLRLLPICFVCYLYAFIYSRFRSVTTTITASNEWPASCSQVCTGMHPAYPLPVWRTSFGCCIVQR